MTKEIQYQIKEVVQEFADGKLKTQYCAIFKRSGWFQSWKYLLDEFSSEKVAYATDISGIQRAINRHRKANTPPLVTIKSFTEDGKAIPGDAV